MAAWPAAAEARPTPSSPPTGPATGVTQDTRIAMPTPCNHKGARHGQLCKQFNATDDIRRHNALQHPSNWLEARNEGGRTVQAWLGVQAR